MRVIGLAVSAACVILTGCGDGATESVSEHELDNFYLTDYECKSFYRGDCFCAPSEKNLKQLNMEILTYSSYVEAMERFNNVWKGASSEQIVDAFQWGDRLSEAVPELLCVAGSLEVFREVGQPSRDQVVEFLVARQEQEVATAEVAEVMERIVTSSAEGDSVNIVSNNLDLIPVPFAGRMTTNFSVVDFSSLPEEFQNRHIDSWFDDRAALSCLSVAETDIVSMSADEFFGVYITGRATLRLAFEADLTSERVARGEDYCTITEFTRLGTSVKLGEENLIRLTSNMSAGDVFVVKKIGGYGAYRPAPAAVIRLD